MKNRFYRELLFNYFKKNRLRRLILFHDLTYFHNFTVFKMLHIIRRTKVESPESSSAVRTGSLNYLYVLVAEWFESTPIIRGH